MNSLGLRNPYREFSPIYRRFFQKTLIVCNEMSATIFGALNDMKRIIGMLSCLRVSLYQGAYPLMCCQFWWRELHFL